MLQQLLQTPTGYKTCNISQCSLSLQEEDYLNNTIDDEDDYSRCDNRSFDSKADMILDDFDDFILFEQQVDGSYESESDSDPEEIEDNMNNEREDNNDDIDDVSDAGNDGDNGDDNDGDNDGVNADDSDDDINGYNNYDNGDDDRNNDDNDDLHLLVSSNITIL